MRNHIDFTCVAIQITNAANDDVSDKNVSINIKVGMQHVIYNYL